MISAAKIGVLFFGGCYFALIAGSIYVVKESTVVSDVLVGFRVALMLAVTLLWISVNALSTRLAIGIVLAASVVLMYSISGVYAQAVDVAMLLITADLVLRRCDLDRHMYTIAKYSLFFASAIALFAIGGMIPAPVHETESITKASLGFWNPNTYYLYAFSSAIVFFVLKHARLFWLSLVVIGVFATFGGSRTYLFGSGLLGLAWVLLHLRSGAHIVGIGSLITYALVGIVGVASTVYVQQLAMLFQVVSGADLNQLVSRRIEILERVASEQGAPSLWMGGYAPGSDSTYEYLSSGFGLPFLCGVLVLVLAVMIKYFRARSPRSMAAIASVALVGLFEIVIDGSLLLSLFLILLILRKLPPVKLSRSSPDASAAAF